MYSEARSSRFENAHSPLPELSGVMGVNDSLLTAAVLIPEAPEDEAGKCPLTLNVGFSGLVVVPCCWRLCVMKAAFSL